jgi:hypothetical protein
MAYSCPQLISRLTSIGQQAYYLIAVKQECSIKGIPTAWRHVSAALDIRGQ